MRNYRYWTGAEVKFILSHSERMSIAEIAQAIGRSEESVSRCVRRLKVKFDRLRHKWTAEEDAILRKYYATKTCYELQDMFEDYIPCRLIQVHANSIGLWKERRPSCSAEAMEDCDMVRKGANDE